MRKMKAYFSQTVDYPMWAIWTINLYVAFLAFKWGLNALIWVLELFL